MWYQQNIYMYDIYIALSVFFNILLLITTFIFISYNFESGDVYSTNIFSICLSLILYILFLWYRICVSRQCFYCTFDHLEFVIIFRKTCCELLTLFQRSCYIFQQWPQEMLEDAKVVIWGRKSKTNRQCNDQT
jgi:hypothetical protein